MFLKHYTTLSNVSVLFFSYYSCVVSLGGLCYISISSFKGLLTYLLSAALPIILIFLSLKAHSIVNILIFPFSMLGIKSWTSFLRFASPELFHWDILLDPLFHFETQLSKMVLTWNHPSSLSWVAGLEVCLVCATTSCLWSCFKAVKCSSSLCLYSYHTVHLVTDVWWYKLLVIQFLQIHSYRDVFENLN